jgi:hypothetical protein
MSTITQDQAREEWWHVRGSNADIDAGTEDMDPTGALALPAAAAATTIVSASTDDVGAGETPGTGAHTVRVVGLTAAGALVAETASLNGTTAVTLTGVYLRILEATVLTAGTGLVNAGAVTLEHSSTVIGTIPAGECRLNRAAYTVPDGRRARIQTWRAHAGIAADGVLTFALLVRPSGGAWQTIDAVKLADVTPGLPVERTIPGGWICEAGTDVKITATSSAANMDGYADIHGTLEAPY